MASFKETSADACCHTSNSSGPLRGNRGFTYLGLLFMIAIMGAVAAQAASLWSIAERRDREAMLLSIGHEFRRAIGDYYEHTPGMVKRYPEKLEDLLLDNRYVVNERRLRRIYRDPISGRTEWGLVMAHDGGIRGIYSLSPESTVKRSRFDRADQDFEGKSHYSDWQFAYTPDVLR
jgi:hypothetical protein